MCQGFQSFQVAGHNTSRVWLHLITHHLLCRWLDSSKTLYEQDVKEGDLLYMRFKYYSFMGIDTRVSGGEGGRYVERRV